MNIPVTANTQLSFWTNPQNALGRYVSVDFIMTDGSDLRDTHAVDQNGVSMHPAVGRGTVNTWTQTICNIGTWLNGKTIDRILVAYDHGAETGDFSSYIDDVSINNTSGQSFVANPVVSANITANTISQEQRVTVLSNPFTENISIRFSQLPKNKVGIHLYDISGKLLISKQFNPATVIQLAAPFKAKGVYLLETTADGTKFMNRVVKE